MTAREGGCLKCGRSSGIRLVLSDHHGVALVEARCSCGHRWRPRKPVQFPDQRRRAEEAA